MKTRSQAIRKAMDYLAMRDHSPHELRTKLGRLDFLEEDIAAALEYVETNGWLLPSETLAQKVADQLHRKGKSHYYISQYLKQKKLPPVSRISEVEFEKAQALIRDRFLLGPKEVDKKKIIQYLKNRGYDPGTISKVIHDASRATKDL